MTLVRSSPVAASLPPAPSSSTAAPQPHALLKSESAPTLPTPAPARPKRVRSVSATIDIGAVSIPTARTIAPEGGGGGGGQGARAGPAYTIYDIRVKPLTGRSGWWVKR